jgi:hypothetical protein
MEKTSDLGKEYTYLFGEVSKAITYLEDLIVRLKHAQLVSEELFINGGEERDGEAAIEENIGEADVV